MVRRCSHLPLLEVCCLARSSSTCFPAKIKIKQLRGVQRRPAAASCSFQSDWSHPLLQDPWTAGKVREDKDGCLWGCGGAVTWVMTHLGPLWGHWCSSQITSMDLRDNTQWVSPWTLWMKRQRNSQFSPQWVQGISNELPLCKPLSFTGISPPSLHSKQDFLPAWVLSDVERQWPLSSSV